MEVELADIISEAIWRRKRAVRLETESIAAYLEDDLARWVERGVALVQDMWDPGMLPSHIFKKRWAEHARKLGYQARDVPGYFNSGFIGIAGKLQEWMSLEAEPSIWISFVISMLVLALIMKKG